MKTLFKCMVDTLDYLTLRLPQLSYHAERDTIVYRLKDGTTGQVTVRFTNKIEINSNGELVNKKECFVLGYLFDNQEFLTLADVVLRIANNHELNIYFGATACDDVEALISPFNSNPFRTYTEFPRLAKAVLLFNQADQLKCIKTFNRVQCLDGFKFSEIYPLSNKVIATLKQRLKAYNTAHAEQLEFLK